MGTIARGKVQRGDLANWDGKTATATRVDATGGTITGRAVGNEVDVAEVYGDGSRTLGAISAAVQKIGSSTVTLVFAPGTWTIDDDLTIPSNLTCHIPAGCLLEVATGKTLTINGHVEAGLYQIFSGSGTVAGLDKNVGVYPQWWGAVLDGTTDDTSAVTAWINAGLQGAPLYHPGGNALCSTWTQIALTSDLHIVSYNNGEITGTSSDNFLQPGAGDLTIDGLHFDTWSNVLENANADAGTTDWLRVTNCEFESVDQFCIRIQNEMNNCLIDSNYFHDLATGAILIGDNVYAQQDDTQRITLTNNKCKDITNAGSGNCHFALVFGKYVNISDNQIENINANTGAAWGIYTKARYGVIANNNINDIVSASSVDACIQIKGDQRGAASIPESYVMNVCGNTILGSQTGVTSTGIGAHTEDVHIHGNFVEDCTIGVEVANAADGVSVLDNVLIARANTAGNFGVSANAGDNIKINGNRASGFFHGVKVNSTSKKNYQINDNNITDSGSIAINVDATTALTNVQIHDNQIDVATAAIFYDFCFNLSIQGNRWIGLTNPVTTWVHGEAATSGDIYISGNSPFEVTTTDATTTSIFRIYAEDGYAYEIEANILANEVSSGQRALYKKGGLFYGASGSATQQGSTYDLITDIESDAAWDVIMGVSGAIARVRVAGDASNNVKFAADVTVRSVKAAA